MKHVLFVCIGNACRSQMAEGFARTYGHDVLVPYSAGLAPSIPVPSATLRAMREKNIDLAGCLPKGLHQLPRSAFDLIVNMSGAPLPAGLRGPVRDWEVPDPILYAYDRHCEIRDQIEHEVMNLILELRRGQKRDRR